MYRPSCQHTSFATAALDYAVTKYESQCCLRNCGVVRGRSRGRTAGGIEHQPVLPVNHVSQQRNKLSGLSAPVYSRTVQRSIFPPSKPHNSRLEHRPTPRSSVKYDLARIGEE